MALGTRPVLGTGCLCRLTYGGFTIARLQFSSVQRLWTRLKASYSDTTGCTTEPVGQPTVSCKLRGGRSHRLYAVYVRSMAMFIHREAGKTLTTFLLWINLLIRNVNWQNSVLLLLLNIIIDDTYLISGIYTNFHRLLCEKCDVGYYVIYHGVMIIDDYRLVFIVSISLLHKIPKACQN